MNEVASVTVLFHPNSEAIDSISSYSQQVQKCFFIDNSPLPLADISRQHIAGGDFAYRHMGANVGSAAGLNEGVRMAAAEGYRFVLTMDQDSRCSPRMVDLLLDGFHDSDRLKSSIAVACPASSTESLLPGGSATPWSEVGFCITSGSLIDTNVWKMVGGFDEQLFIDYVDHEYCLRVRAAGYRIMSRRDAILHHHTGHLRRLDILGFRRTISIHEPERLFYMTRNGLLLKSRYGSQFPEVGLFVRTRIVAQAVKSMIFGPERRRRLACMMRGYRAYKVGLPARA
jgi:rhamnosyltransferase